MKIFLGFLGGFLLAGIAAGGIWYIMNNQISEIQTSLDNSVNQVVSLETKNTELQSAVDSYTQMELQSAENLTKYIEFSAGSGSQVSDLYAEDAKIYTDGETISGLTNIETYFKKQELISVKTKSQIVDTPISFTKDNWSVLVEEIETPKTLSLSFSSSTGATSSGTTTSTSRAASLKQKEKSYNLKLVHWADGKITHEFNFSFRGNASDIDFNEIMRQVVETMNNENNAGNVQSASGNINQEVSSGSIISNATGTTLGNASGSQLNN